MNRFKDAQCKDGEFITGIQVQSDKPDSFNLVGICGIKIFCSDGSGRSSGNWHEVFKDYSDSYCIKQKK